MQPRLARSTVGHKSRTANAVKSPRKRTDRNLNAFSIATKTDPVKTRIRQHRLGESEPDVDEPKHKRRRLSGNASESEEDENASISRQAQRRSIRKRNDEDLEASSGSDSEGNHWHVGFERSGDEDEELDSDEAFGESDEERFEDFTFRGSKSQISKKQKTAQGSYGSCQRASVEQSQHDAYDDHDYQSEDSLGSDAIDLATALDLETSDAEPTNRSDKAQNLSTSSAADDDFGGWSQEEQNVRSGNNSEASGSGEENESLVSSVDDAEDDGGRKQLQQLKGFVASMSKSESPESDSEIEDRQLRPGALLKALNDMPSKSLVTKKQKAADPAGEGPVRAPLPKRQQDGIDRQAAYREAKDTLDRWQDTVKHNRRADHLKFPLQPIQGQEAPGYSRILPVPDAHPQNELETTIHDILEASGLARSRRQTNLSKDGVTGDELPANEPSLEDVLARRAELRRTRDILFREEQRSKRIKKIKSKAFRRVHRKERERNVQKEHDLLAATGLEPSDDDKERIHRRRAEERMGARHRESKWAKSIKKTGRAAWDENGKSMVAEMARRDEELRRRIQGKSLPSGREDDESYSSNGSVDGVDDHDYPSDASHSGGESEALQQASSADQKTRLGSLKFMQRADQRQKLANDELMKSLGQALAAERGDSEGEKQYNPGRKIFGPGKNNDAPESKRQPRNEFEEGPESESENDQTLENPFTTNDSSGGDLHLAVGTNGAQVAQPRSLPLAGSTKPKSVPEENVRSTKKTTSDAAGKPVQRATTSHETSKVQSKNLQKMTPKATTLIQTGRDTNYNDDSAEDLADTAHVTSNEALVRAAFGVDESAATDFDSEKRAAVDSEDEKLVDNGLPGWGSWAGAGVSKKQKAFAKQKAQRFQTKENGVKAADRKDANLRNVIVSEKRMRKNAKYLAPALPHPYESHQQYERSLRLPIGPEWTTQDSFQSATKPRILIKQGVIQPMETPLL